MSGAPSRFSPFVEGRTPTESSRSHQPLTTQEPVELELNKASEIRSAEVFRDEIARSGQRTKPFGLQWSSSWWLKWALVHHALRALDVPSGGRILELGSGTGWMALLLAEAGFSVVGVDIAPANVELAAAHGGRWGVDATFRVADLEHLNLDDRFDAVLAFDVLHHLARPEEAVVRAAGLLEHGGVMLIGEPSWLHRISPRAHHVHRQAGWIERGMTIRELKRYGRAAGLGEFRRFFESTRPYESRAQGFIYEGMRLIAANAFVAPEYSVWLAARKR